MIKVNILGHSWKVYLHTEDDFCRMYGDHDAAFVLPQEREVHFNEGDLTLRVVKHELTHCYFTLLCVEAAQLSLDQQEEVFCEMMAEHGDKLLRLARHLYKELNNA